MIQNPRPGAPTGYWDGPVNLLRPGQAELLFISYFDWNQMEPTYQKLASGVAVPLLRSVDKTQFATSGSRSLLSFLAHQPNVQPQVIEVRPQGRWNPQVAGSIFQFV